MEYVVQENKVIIVDENTGRQMPGRRWSDGLHQAVEAKEGVQIERETQTLATITIQNYFRLYQKLAGMTGTAETEATEFHDIYKLDVLVIPTNRPVQRKDANDRIYKTRREKYNAVLKEIQRVPRKGQPDPRRHGHRRGQRVARRMLKRRRSRTPCSTRSTTSRRPRSSRAPASAAPSPSPPTWPAAARTSNSAPASPDAGRPARDRHRAPRRPAHRPPAARPLRAPGRPRLVAASYISFEDDLMRIFGSGDRMTKIMERFGLEEGQELEHPWLDTLRREGAEARRAAQFPDPQAHAGVRRRDEQAARGHLRLPQGHDRHARRRARRSAR